MKIITVAGARPNFIKIAPLYRAFKKNEDKVKHLICHTGQHFDKNMSKIFFEQLEMPEPDFNLGIGSGTHADQTARIMVEFEKVLNQEKPDLILVPGDVNSTLACSVVASKMGIKIGHVEAGLRSFDRGMPEEINRIVTDVLSDYLFVSENSGITHLRQEGIPEERIHFVGNIMIDSLVHMLPKIENSEILGKLDINTGHYTLMTFHRPSNVDTKNSLERLVGMLNLLSAETRLVFPIHPRTKKNLEEHGLSKELNPGIILLDPIGYIDFLALTRSAELVITDSGGIQEETTFLGVQCITVRDNTERPVTVTEGTNQLIGTDLEEVEKAAIKVLAGEKKKGRIPELWDGRTADRIVDIIAG
ncbi:non-hydrolyzing UDP-N-acetylglucosamine 2-epimerase [Bacteroidota bacterium]